jgi:hypothetical protein
MYTSELSKDSDLCEFNMPSPQNSRQLPEPIQKREHVVQFVIDCKLARRSHVLACCVMAAMLCVGLSDAASPEAVSFVVIITSSLFILTYKFTRLSVIFSENGMQAAGMIYEDTLHKRTFRSWSDLHGVRLRKRFLTFEFKSVGTLTIPLFRLSKEALEVLFLSLSRWADPMTLNSDVVALQRRILAGERLQSINGYTELWEQGFRQTLEATNFVPLPNGHELRNGELRVLMLLACGGVSCVYLAHNSHGNRIVVKELAVPLDENDATLAKLQELFAREAEILAKLDHPRIVRVVDHFVENKRDYLVLDFVPGLTLRQLVQSHGPLNEDDVRNIGKQIADLLTYMHSFNPPIVHRDVTPDNLVLGEPDNTVTLIDFGAANEIVSKVTGTLIGKQCYIPPEQFRGKAVPQSDIYGAGATLHYLLTGHDPEPIATSHPRLNQPQLSLQIDELIAKATAIEVESRIQSAAELRQRLELSFGKQLGSVHAI